MHEVSWIKCTVYVCEHVHAIQATSVIVCAESC